MSRLSIIKILSVVLMCLSLVSCFDLSLDKNKNPYRLVPKGIEETISE